MNGHLLDDYRQGRSNVITHVKIFFYFIFFFLERERETERRESHIVRLGKYIHTRSVPSNIFLKIMKKETRTRKWAIHYSITTFLIFLKICWTAGLLFLLFYFVFFCLIRWYNKANGVIARPWHSSGPIFFVKKSMEIAFKCGAMKIIISMMNFISWFFWWGGLWLFIHSQFPFHYQQVHIKRFFFSTRCFLNNKRRI
jgi:hypothetical protein